MAITFSACELFETRDPEKPTQGGSTFLQPTTPDIVLTNLKNAISELSSENYLRCLVDTLTASRTFVFIPTASSTAQYPTVFQHWSLQSERSYFEKLKSVMQPGAVASLQLSGAFQFIASDSALYNANYQLTTRHAISGIPESMAGNVQFVLITDRNRAWSIVQWIDTGIGANAAWSDLKGRFAN